MDTKEYIEFKKQRELGDIVSDTFVFMRAQFKPFFETFFKIVGPFLLVMLICQALYIYYIGDQNSLMLKVSESTVNPLLIVGVMLLYLCSFLLVYAISQSTVLHYIKSYTDGKGQIDFEEIRANVQSTFWPFVGLIFLVAITFMLGILMCCIPGIYLWVPLSLSFSILVFQKTGILEAFSSSFQLIRDHWWMTFATLLVIMIIVFIASLGFSIPIVMYTWAKMGILSGELDAESMMELSKDPIHIVLNLIGSVAQIMLNIISLVAGVLIYFNLNEKKNFTGTLERIENLGNTPEN